MNTYLTADELEALAYLVDEVKDTARFLTFDKAETREDVARLWGDLDYLKEQLEKALDLTRSHL